ncbi:unnamed protein product, partial [marine sediment metagenome]
ALVIYVYGQNNAHTWITIHGKGSTDEWVTVMLPFDTSKKPDLSLSRIMLRCYKISGTVWLQNPAIVELPASADMKSGFILKDGSIVSGHLVIK